MRSIETRSHRHVRRLKDDFLSLAAHEIRTPITAIKAQAQLAQRFHAEGKLHDTAVRRCLRNFVRESDRLSDLCADLLDVARLDNRSLEVKSQAFEASRLIRACLARERRNHPRRRISFSRVGSVTARTWADPERFRQVLRILVGNAARHSPDGGAIRVALRAGESRVEVSVRDEGVGIPQERIAKLFRRYYQPHQSGLSGSSGLGIGLYLCKRLLARMGGAIRARSDGPGQGAEFIFDLPSMELQQ